MNPKPLSRTTRLIVPLVILASYFSPLLVSSDQSPLSCTNTTVVPFIFCAASTAELVGTRMRITADRALRDAASDAACEPLFQVIPFLPGFLLRSGLVDIIIPMLPTRVGLVALIEALLCRPTPVASRARVVNPTPCVRLQRPPFVFPSGNRVAVLVVGVVFHLVVLPHHAP
jgi:hypothetical protein